MFGIEDINPVGDKSGCGGRNTPGLPPASSTGASAPFEIYPFCVYASISFSTLPSNNRIQISSIRPSRVRTLRSTVLS
jgi:hypothetical protein